MSSPSKLLLVLAGSLTLASVPAMAAPLDDRIAEFEKAADQNEGLVIKVLQQGLKENRSARAYAATKAWLLAQPGASPNLSYHAGKVAERAGEWTAAVGFYRKVIRTPSPTRLSSMKQFHPLIAC